MIYIVLILTLYFHIASCARNFALYKLAQQSSTLYYKGFAWSANKAVDGNAIGLMPDTSKTCSATANDPNGTTTHSWHVYIGFTVIIKNVTVYGRVKPDQLSGFELYLGNTTHIWLTRLKADRIQRENNIHRFESINLAASVISVARRNVRILTLCEVTVEGECLDGVYSEYCNNTCGRCHNGHSCDKESGICPDGCDPGWREELCNVESSEFLSQTLYKVALTVIGGSVVVICAVALIIRIVLNAALKIIRNNDTGDINMETNALGRSREETLEESVREDTSTPSYYNAASLCIQNMSTTMYGNVQEITQMKEVRYENLQDQWRMDVSTYSNMN